MASSSRSHRRSTTPTVRSTSRSRPAERSTTARAQRTRLHRARCDASTTSSMPARNRDRSGSTGRHQANTTSSSTPTTCRRDRRARMVCRTSSSATTPSATSRSTTICVQRGTVEDLVATLRAAPVNGNVDAIKDLSVESLALPDTNFVAVGGDRRRVAFGEANTGGRAGRVLARLRSDPARRRTVRSSTRRRSRWRT